MRAARSGSRAESTAKLTPERPDVAVAGGGWDRRIPRRRLLGAAERFRVLECRRVSHSLRRLRGAAAARARARERADASAARTTAAATAASRARRASESCFRSSSLPPPLRRRPRLSRRARRRLDGAEPFRVPVPRRFRRRKQPSYLDFFGNDGFSFSVASFLVCFSVRVFLRRARGHASGCASSSLRRGRSPARRSAPPANCPPSPRPARRFLLTVAAFFASRRLARRVSSVDARRLSPPFQSRLSRSPRASTAPRRTLRRRHRPARRWFRKSRRPRRRRRRPQRSRRARPRRRRRRRRGARLSRATSNVARVASASARAALGEQNVSARAS